MGLKASGEHSQLQGKNEEFVSFAGNLYEL